MAVDPNRLAVDQLTRILDSMGWSVAKVDLTQPDIVLEIRRPKQVQVVPAP